MKENSTPKAITIWLTGLSGSGKTTLAKQLKAELETSNWPIINLDGDELRKGIHKDLDFSDASRKENIRRTAELSNLLNDSKILHPLFLHLKQIGNWQRRLLEITDLLKFFVTAHCPFVSKETLKACTSK